MSQAVPFSDLSSDPRGEQDRLRAQPPYEFPGSSPSFVESNLSTIVASVAAAVVALLIGLWLAGVGRKKRPAMLPSMNRAELAYEFAPVAAKLLSSPAIRAYLLRLAVRSLTRKITG